MSALVVDTSAIVAVALNEQMSPAIEAALIAADDRLVSAASMLEAGMVLGGRLGEAGTTMAARLAHDVGMEIVPVDEAQVTAALSGWWRFGKGRHPAGLNLGDCFVYGLAVTRDLEVLCLGDDFSQTDAAVVDLDR